MISVTTKKPSPRTPRGTHSRSAAAAPLLHHALRSSYSTPRASFEQTAAQVLGELQHALTDLFNAAPTTIRKIADVEKAFGVNHLLAWQLYRIVHAQNPLGAGMHVPAEVSIKKLLTAAARRKLPAAIINRVSDAFEAFEQLVNSDAGDREDMEAMLSAFLPEERRKQALASRQFAFKGMSQIKGVVVECATTTFLLHPSPDGRTLDRAIVDCELGLRRMRPDARIVIGTADLLKPDSSVTTLDGAPADAPLGSLLSQFSTTPLPRLEARGVTGMNFYRVAGEDIAMRSAIDLVTANRRSGALPAYFEPGAARFRGYAYILHAPAKRATMDIFVHKDAYPDVVPRLLVYDTSSLGFVSSFGDPTREDDLLVTYDELRLLPTGLAGARIPHVPRYLELLEYAYEKLGWNPAEFRGYRLDVQYPVYGAEYMFGFEVPNAPPSVAGR